VNSAAEKKKSTNDELTAIFREYTNKKQYMADFRDITQGDSTARRVGIFAPGLAPRSPTRESN